MLNLLEHKMVHGFIIGLSFSLYLEIEHLIVAGFSFPLGVDHARDIERTCIEIYGGGDKKPCHYYSAIGIPSKSEDSPGGDQLAVYQLYIGSVLYYSWLIDQSL